MGESSTADADLYEFKLSAPPAEAAGAVVAPAPGRTTRQGATAACRVLEYRQPEFGCKMGVSAENATAADGARHPHDRYRIRSSTEGDRASRRYRRFPRYGLVLKFRRAGNREVRSENWEGDGISGADHQRRMAHRQSSF